MFRKIAVGDIMTRNFASVGPNATLHHCAKEMVKQRVNSLLITQGKKLLGIITARDILWTLTKKLDLNLKDMLVEEIATKKIAVIKPSADINQALFKMKKFGFRRLPVLHKGEIVGLITLKDILKINPDIYPEIAEMQAIREESEKLKRISSQEESYSEGLCHECDSFAPLLKIENRLLCPTCRDELY